MGVIIQEKTDDEDMEFFFRLGFWALKTLRKSMFDQIMSDHPDATDEEAFEVHKKEACDYMDFSKPEVKIFIASQDGNRCGYLWIAPRNSKDGWDIERPQWIYDIVVDPRFQGKGIGRELMEKAEDYARELKQNIGLFVHADNESAIALYKKTGYHTKVVPISKRLIGPVEVTPVNGLRVDQVSNPESTVRDMEYRNFRDKVLFSTDVEDKMIVARFERYLESSARPNGKQSRFVAYSDAGMCVGSVLIGTSGFDEKVAMVYVIAVTTEEKQQVGNILIKSAEKWAVEQGFGTIYILLHSEDDLDLEFFKEREYKVPGYFMEFRVI